MSSIIRIMVVWPAPLGPSNPKISPPLAFPGDTFHRHFSGVTFPKNFGHILKLDFHGLLYLKDSFVYRFIFDRESFFQMPTNLRTPTC